MLSGEPMSQCPSAELIADCLLGRASADVDLEVSSHIEGCSACSAVAARCDASCSDALVGALRAKPPAAEAKQDPFYENAAERVLRFVNETGVSAHIPARERTELIQVRDYQLIRKLGEGGMGTVYKALHTRLNRVVALKVLPPDRMRDDVAVARFQREMRAAGTFDHPAIVRATDAGDLDGTHFLVMEYVEGLDASTLVERMGPLPIADACEIIRRAAEGLAHVHERGMIHRDVKPSNLMVTPAGQVKILDLGLALLQDQAHATHELTTVGQFLGTLDYMAPEQVDDSHEVDARADLYSLGASLYKLLTGSPPYAGEEYRSPLRKLKGLALLPVPPIRECRADVPPELAAIVEKMLAKEPESRFASAAEIATVLASFASGSSLKTLVCAAMKKEDRRAGLLDANSAREFFGASRGTQAFVSPAPGSTPPGGRSRIGRRLAAAAAFFALVAAGIVIYVQTDAGELVIRSPEDGVQVLVRKAGETVKNFVLKSGENAVTLRSGSYEILLGANTDGLAVDDDKVTLTRGGQEVVTVERRKQMLDATPVLSDADTIRRILEAADPGLSEAELKRQVEVNRRILDAERHRSERLETEPPQQERRPQNSATYGGMTFEEWASVVENERKPERVQEAITALGELADKSQSALAAKLILDAMAVRTRDWGEIDVDLSQLRLAGLKALKKLDTPDAVRAVADVLRSGTLTAKYFALLALSRKAYSPAAIPGNFNDPTPPFSWENAQLAVPAVVEVLSEESLRQWSEPLAVQLAPESEAVKKHLRNRLRESSPDQALSAAILLSQMAPPHDDELVEFLDGIRKGGSPKPEDQAAAAAALAHIAPETDGLVQTVVESLKAQPNDPNILRAISALGRRAAAAAPTLIEAPLLVIPADYFDPSSKRVFNKDTVQLRIEALGALGSAANRPEAVKLLRGWIFPNSQYGEAAAAALKAIGAEPQNAEQTKAQDPAPIAIVEHPPQEADAEPPGTGTVEALGQAASTPPQESDATSDDPQPIVIDANKALANDLLPLALEPRTKPLVVYQRETVDVPGSNGELKLRLGDITRGQVHLSVTRAGKTVIERRSVKKGEAVPLDVGGQSYEIIVRDLTNHLADRDWATIEIVPRRSEADKIEQLLQRIAESDAIFIRDGERYNGKEAEQHLRQKLEQAGDEISTLEQFIEKIASRSTLTGNEYMVETRGGELMPAREWLRSLLEPEGSEPAKTDGAAELSALYGGRTFDEWAQVVRRERQSQEIAHAMIAVAELATLEQSGDAAQLILNKVADVAPQDDYEKISGDIVNAASYALKKLDTPHAVAVLDDALLSGKNPADSRLKFAPSVTQRLYAIRALSRSEDTFHLGDTTLHVKPIRLQNARAAAPGIIAALRDKDAEVRGWAILIGADVIPENEELHEVLQSRLQDPVVGTALSAARMLARIAPDRPGIADAAQRAIKSSQISAVERAQAFEVLSIVAPETPRLAADITEHLQHQRGDTYASGSYLAALQRLGPKAEPAVAVIAEEILDGGHLNEVRLWLADPPIYVDALAIKVLHAVGPAAWTPAVRKRLEQLRDGRTGASLPAREAAADALERWEELRSSASTDSSANDISTVAPLPNGVRRTAAGGEGTYRGRTFNQHLDALDKLESSDALIETMQAIAKLAGDEREAIAAARIFEAVVKHMQPHGRSVEGDKKRAVIEAIRILRQMDSPDAIAAVTKAFAPGTSSSARWLGYSIFARDRRPFAAETDIPLMDPAAAKLAAPAMLGALDDPDEETRYMALAVLAELDPINERVRQHIDEIVRDQDPDYAMRGVQLLIRIDPQGEQTQAVLHRLIAEPLKENSDVYRELWAAEQLAAHAPDSPELVETLVSILEFVRGEQLPGDWTAKAVHTLGKLGQRADAAVPVIVEVLDTAESAHSTSIGMEATNSADSFGRTTGELVIDTLVAIGTPAARDAIQKIADNGGLPGHIRQHAIEAAKASTTQAAPTESSP